MWPWLHNHILNYIKFCKASSLHIVVSWCFLHRRVQYSLCCIVQMENGILLPTLQSALPFLDLHGTPRLEFHQSVFDELRDKLMERVAHIAEGKDEDRCVIGRFWLWLMFCQGLSLDGKDEVCIRPHNIETIENSALTSLYTVKVKHQSEVRIRINTVLSRGLCKCVWCCFHRTADMGSLKSCWRRAFPSSRCHPFSQW